MKKKQLKSYSAHVLRLIKLPLYVIILSCLVYSCSSKDEANYLTIGFGKANLSPAGIYEDPVSIDQETSSVSKYTREDKFAISDRVEGRWRPGSGGIRKLVDSIYVSAMYGEDMNGPWAIITVDATQLDYKQLDNLEYPLIHQLEIPKERLVFLPSHGHSTPPLDPGLYQATVLEAVIQAKENRSEVEIASMNLILNGKEYVINRRVHVDGVGSRTVMFNDDCVVHEDYLDATVHLSKWVEKLGVNPTDFLEPGKTYVTDGKVDDKLQALFMRDKRTGDLKGSFLRFAAHAVIVSSKVVNGDVSADFPGYLKRKIENELGGIALFGQGACGELRPLNDEYSHECAKQYGEKLALEIVKEYNSLHWESLTKLAYYTEPVNLPLLENIYFSEEELKIEMDEVESQYDKEINPLQKRMLQNKFWSLYRIPQVDNMVRAEWKEKKVLDVKLFGLQFNDKVIVAIQGEIFSQIGNDIIQPFADQNPILVSLANEYISYIPTDEERQKGGY